VREGLHRGKKRERRRGGRRECEGGSKSAKVRARGPSMAGKTGRKNNYIYI